MTKEEQIALDAWREKEVWRIVKAMGSSIPEMFRTEHRHNEYRRLVRDDIRPPVVLDQLLIEAREICASVSDEDGLTKFAEKYRAGDCDHTTMMYAACAALKRGIELGKAEGERAGIERALNILRINGHIGSVTIVRGLIGELQ